MLDTANLLTESHNVIDSGSNGCRDPEITLVQIHLLLQKKIKTDKY